MAGWILWRVFEGVSWIGWTERMSETSRVKCVGTGKGRKALCPTSKILRTLHEWSLSW